MSGETFVRYYQYESCPSRDLWKEGKSERGALSGPLHSLGGKKNLQESTKLHAKVIIIIIKVQKWARYEVAGAQLVLLDLI